MDTTVLSPAGPEDTASEPSTPGSSQEISRDNGQRRRVPRRKRVARVYKCVPIQPRPDPQSSSPSSPEEPVRSCRVWLCKQKDCKLRTHAQYTVFRNKNPKKRSIHDVDVDDEEGQHGSQSAAVDDLSTRGRAAQQLLITRGLSGLPSLPLGEEGKSSNLRQLVHFYFSHDYDRIYRLLLPPPFTRQQKLARREIKDIALAKALSAPAYCIHYAAVAQSIRSGDNDSRNGVFLRTKATSLFKQRLSTLVQEEFEEIPSLMFALIIFDLAADNSDSFLFYRQAIEYFLERCGGVDNLKKHRVIFLTLDRTLSILTGLPLLHEQPPDRFIRKAVTIPYLYGAYLDELSSYSVLGSKIHQYCSDVCRAIEMLEVEGWTFDPDDPPIGDSKNIHYWFFFRDCLLNHFVQLNIETADDKTVARCFLLTTKIVEYITLMDGYMINFPHALANQIRNIICLGDSGTYWPDHQNVLIWMLFVITGMAGIWTWRPWALNLLKQQLDLKYFDDIWPTAWRQYELDNVHRFPWSDTRLNGRFVGTCNELQYLGLANSQDMLDEIEQLYQ